MDAMNAVLDSTSFSGSYAPEEVTFLMRRMQMKTTALEQREVLIQSGGRHYSEMIGPEDAPTRERLRLFRACMVMNAERMAQDIAVLATALAASAVDGDLTVVSIARAGTPVGVLLLYRLRQIAPQLRVMHYSISVIRDRGVDVVALSWIMARHSPGSLRFVDGWTGKGTIARELQHSIAAWEAAPAALDSGLWVPLDVCGVARFAASSRDYLIPSTLLGGTISGLVSRSVLPRGEEGQLHGCVQLSHLKRHDLSRWFVRKMIDVMKDIAPGSAQPENATGGAARHEEIKRCLHETMTQHGLVDVNRVKLGIGETVRVLLRRLPQVVCLSPNTSTADAQMIRRLAELRNVPVLAVPAQAVDALAVIASAKTNTPTFE
jgi:ribosomal protein L30E